MHAVPHSTSEIRLKPCSVSSFFEDLFKLCVCVCVCTQRSKAPIYIELELQVIVSHLK